MTKRRKQNLTMLCSRCQSKYIREVRRTQVYKGVVIENIPATYCPDCGEELYDAATVSLMEQIATDPQHYARMVEMPVATLA